MKKLFRRWRPKVDSVVFKRKRTEKKKKLERRQSTVTRQTLVETEAGAELCAVLGRAVNGRRRVESHARKKPRGKSKTRQI